MRVFKIPPNRSKVLVNNNSQILTRSTFTVIYFYMLEVYVVAEKMENNGKKDEVKQKEGQAKRKGCLFFTICTFVGECGQSFQETRGEHRKEATYNRRGSITSKAKVILDKRCTPYNVQIGRTRYWGE